MAKHARFEAQGPGNGSIAWQPLVPHVKPVYIEDENDVFRRHDDVRTNKEFRGLSFTTIDELTAAGYTDKQAFVNEGFDILAGHKGRCADFYEGVNDMLQDYCDTKLSQVSLVRGKVYAFRTKLEGTRHEEGREVDEPVLVARRSYTTYSPSGDPVQRNRLMLIRYREIEVDESDQRVKDLHEELIMLQTNKMEDVDDPANNFAQKEKQTRPVGRMYEKQESDFEEGKQPELPACLEALTLHECKNAFDAHAATAQMYRLLQEEFPHFSSDKDADAEAWRVDGVDLVVFVNPTNEAVRKQKDPVMVKRATERKSAEHNVPELLTALRDHKDQADRNRLLDVHYYPKNKDKTHENFYKVKGKENKVLLNNKLMQLKPTKNPGRLQIWFKVVKQYVQWLLDNDDGCATSTVREQLQNLLKAMPKPSEIYLHLTKAFPLHLKSIDKFIPFEQPRQSSPNAARLKCLQAMTFASKVAVEVKQEQSTPTTTRKTRDKDTDDGSSVIGDEDSNDDGTDMSEAPSSDAGEESGEGEEGEEGHEDDGDDFMENMAKGKAGRIKERDLKETDADLDEVEDPLIKPARNRKKNKFVADDAEDGDEDEIDDDNEDDPNAKTQTRVADWHRSLQGQKESEALINAQRKAQNWDHDMQDEDRTDLAFERIDEYLEYKCMKGHAIDKKVVEKCLERLNKSEYDALSRDVASQTNCKREPDLAKLTELVLRRWHEKDNDVRRPMEEVDAYSKNVIPLLKKLLDQQQSQMQSPCRKLVMLKTRLDSAQKKESGIDTHQYLLDNLGKLTIEVLRTCTDAPKPTSSTPSDVSVVGQKRKLSEATQEAYKSSFRQVRQYLVSAGEAMRSLHDALKDEMD